jgi:hypothetical protein
MTVEELQKALDKIPDEGKHNKARRAEIIRKIIALQGEKKDDNKNAFSYIP